MYRSSRRFPRAALSSVDENRTGVLAKVQLLHPETRDSAKNACPSTLHIGYAETTEAVWNPATDFAPQKEDVRICTEKLTGKCIANAIRLAVQRADVKPEDVAFVMANGYGSKFHDRIEAEAIASVLGNDVTVQSMQLPVTPWRVRGDFGRCIRFVARKRADSCDSEQHDARFGLSCETRNGCAASNGQKSRSGGELQLLRSGGRHRA